MLTLREREEAQRLAKLGDVKNFLQLMGEKGKLVPVLGHSSYEETMIRLMHALINIEERLRKIEEKLG